MTAGGVTINKATLGVIAGVLAIAATFYTMSEQWFNLVHEVEQNKDQLADHTKNASQTLSDLDKTLNSLNLKLDRVNESVIQQTLATRTLEIEVKHLKESR